MPWILLDSAAPPIDPGLLARPFHGARVFIVRVDYMSPNVSTLRFPIKNMTLIERMEELIVPADLEIPKISNCLDSALAGQTTSPKANAPHDDGGKPARN